MTAGGGYRISKPTLQFGMKLTTLSDFATDKTHRQPRQCHRALARTFFYCAPGHASASNFELIGDHGAGRFAKQRLRCHAISPRGLGRVQLASIQIRHPGLAITELVWPLQQVRSGLVLSMSNMSLCPWNSCPAAWCLLSTMLNNRMVWDSEFITPTTPLASLSRAACTVPEDAVGGQSRPTPPHA
jgi:hypothetical protein